MRTLLICLLAPAAIAVAQDNPVSAFSKRGYGQVKSWLLRSAEKVPEDAYGFRPTDSVRSFAQLFGHVADAQYTFCSILVGEKNPALKIEQTKTAKADLIAAMKDAFAYCEKAYDTITDTSGLQMVKVFGNEMPKVSLQSVIMAHNAEHYGNLVTYMRLKNIVPPSSEPPPPAPPKK